MDEQPSILLPPTTPRAKRSQRKRWHFTLRLSAMGVLAGVALALKVPLGHGHTSDLQGTTLPRGLAGIAIASLVAGLALDRWAARVQSRFQAVCFGMALTVPVGLVGYFTFTPADLTALQVMQFVLLLTPVGGAAAALVWERPS